MFHIHVHPPGLRRTAGVLRTSAEQVGATGHWLDDSLTVAQAQPGWQSSAALTQCANAWQARLTATVQQLQTYSGQLHQSADSYDTANAEAGRRFQQSLNDLQETSW